VKRDLQFLLPIIAAATLSAQGPSLTFTSFSDPTFTGQSGPYQIIPGPDGALWYQGRFNEIGRITTDGAITDYPIPNTLWWAPGSITAGPDGAIWFTEYRMAKIGRITTSGELTEYDIPDFAGAITAGPDGALWFSEGNKIGRMTTSGAVTEYPLPNPDSAAGAIASAPDGAIWFTESSAQGAVVNGATTRNSIARITIDGTITEYALPPATWFQGAWFIVAGPDGAMWFSEYAAGKVGRITMAGAVTEYPISASGGGTGPTSITVGPDGALWFPESNEDYVVHTLGRITTDGVSTEYDVPLFHINYSATIALGPDGALWFTDGWTNNITRAAVGWALTIETTSLSGGRAAASYAAKLTAHGGISPYTWSIAGGSLPPGLNLDSLTGVIGGTPTAAGMFTFQVQVTDSSVPGQSATRAMTITILA
jgi:virginiamycin B lyase